ncbi:MAG: VCBS repeat-containing protein, partial [Thermoplasmata archaeon]
MKRYAFVVSLILVFTAFHITSENYYINEHVTLSKTFGGYINSSHGLPMRGQWPYATGVGDINEDGYMDIIRLRGHDDFDSENQSWQVYYGDGTGNWTKANISNRPMIGYGGTAIGDFNNDGHLDAAYAVHHNRNEPLIGAWAGDGGNSWTNCSSGLATDGETYGMAPIDFGDFNNDGWLDIGVGSFGGGNGLRAYMNHNGTNWTSESNGLPHNDDNPNVGNWLIWADMNRDGYLDIVIMTEIVNTDEEHVIWLGDGNRNWTANDFGLEVEYLWGSYGLDVGDINNDGWLDIAFIKHMESGNDDWYVPVVYTFNGSGWTNASNGLPNPSNYPEITFGPLAFGDMNNDGYLDLVALEYYTTGRWPNILEWTDIHMWYGDGMGNWTETDEIATWVPGEPQSVTLADIDHNNYLDIIITSSRGDYEPGGIRVYKNTTAVSELEITIRTQLKGEVFFPGAAREIEWSTALPNISSTGNITLEYSTTGENGPWYTIDTNLTNTGYYLWHIPNATSSNCYVKATIHWQNEEASDVAGPFTIIGEDLEPPYISNIQATPEMQTPGGYVNITCIVEDNIEVNEVKVNITYPDNST